MAGRLGLEDAVDRLNRQTAVDAVIVDLSVDHGPVADRLLDLLSYIAVRDNRPVVVTTTLPCSIVSQHACTPGRLHSFANPILLTACLRWPWPGVVKPAWAFPM
ncbi:MAG: hypothetical protein IPO50_05045 [Sphingomonadales bacterium]|nr:hypothetical protein [Sphingomonadales bacterium]